MASLEKESRTNFVEKLDDPFREDGFDGAEDRQKVSPSEALEAEQALVRKLDWRILPITCFLYLFACRCFNLPLLGFVLICRSRCRPRPLEPGECAATGSS